MQLKLLCGPKHLLPLSFAGDLGKWIRNSFEAHLVSPLMTKSGRKRIPTFPRVLGGSRMILLEVSDSACSVLTSHFLTKRFGNFWKANSEDVVDDVEARLLGGRGVVGQVDETLPEAIKNLK